MSFNEGIHEKAIPGEACGKGGNHSWGEVISPSIIPPAKKLRRWQRKHRRCTKCGGTKPIE